MPEDPINRTNATLFTFSNLLVCVLLRPEGRKYREAMGDVRKRPPLANNSYQ